MLQSKIGRNFILCFLLLNLLVTAPLVYAALQRPDLLAPWIPGRFGPGLSMDLTGNMLLAAIVLLLNALLCLTFGIGGTWHALWAGLRVSPRKLRRFLHERTGLASDIAGVVAAAIQEEEKDEIVYLDRARGLLAVGIILFAVAVPALCMTYTQAAPDGAPIFEVAGKTIANSQVTTDQIVRFSADQLAALALDIPAVFHLRATQMEINGANLVLGALVVLYRTLIGLGLLLLYVGMRRGRALLFNALEVAMPVSEIVAMEPVLQDGHGHHDALPEHVEHVVHHHVHEEAPADHGHHEHHHEPVHHHHEEPVVHHHVEEEPAAETTVDEVLEDGDVVEIEDADGTVHHAVVHDEEPVHAAPHHHQPAHAHAAIAHDTPIDRTVEEAHEHAAVVVHHHHHEPVAEEEKAA